MKQETGWQQVYLYYDPHETHVIVNTKTKPSSGWHNSYLLSSFPDPSCLYDVAGGRVPRHFCVSVLRCLVPAWELWPCNVARIAGLSSRQSSVFCFYSIFRRPWFWASILIFVTKSRKWLLRAKQKRQRRRWRNTRSGCEPSCWSWD